MMEINTDIIEVAASVTTIAWAMQSLYGVHRAYRSWKDTEIREFRYLRPMALRKIRQQMFLLLWSSIGVLSCAITLFLPIGELQSSIRNYAIAIFSLMGCFRSAVDYLEQRSTDIKNWDGDDRREKDSITSDG